MRARVIAGVVLLLVCGCGDSHDRGTPAAPLRIWVAAAGYGDDGFLLRSDDLGVTWAIGLFADRVLRDVDFVGDRNGWAVGGTGVVHTADGGASWQPQQVDASLGIGTVFANASFFDARRGVIAGADTSGSPRTPHPLLLFATGDGGAHWSRAQVPDTALGNPDAIDLCVAAPDVGLVVSSPSVLLSHDGGASWEDIGSRGDLSVILSPHAVACPSTSDLWVLGSMRAPDLSSLPVLVHSSDGGATWAAVSVPFFDQPIPPTIRPGAGSLSFSDTLHGGLVGLRGEFTDPKPYVVRTNDGGETWTEVTPASPPEDHLLTITLGFSGVGVIGGTHCVDLSCNYPLLLVTSDEGGTWRTGVPPSEISQVYGVDFARSELPEH